MSDFKELEQKVIEWAKDRDLYRLSTDVTRWEKCFEEFEEFEEAAWPIDFDDRDMEEVKIEAGDVLVTIINILHPYGLTMTECLEAAYNKIKDRTGKMENGTYVRDK